MAGLDVLLPVKPSMNLWLVELFSTGKPECGRFSCEG